MCAWDDGGRGGWCVRWAVRLCALWKRDKMGEGRWDETSFQPASSQDVEDPCLAL